MSSSLVRLNWLRLNSNDNCSPIFIIGAGRSGTTLLRRFMMSQDEVYIPPKTYVLGRAIADVRVARFVLDWPSLVTLMLGHLALSADSHTFPTQQHRSVLEALQHIPVSERSLSRIFDAFYRHLALAAGSRATRWGDKTPLNFKALPAL